MTSLSLYPQLEPDSAPALHSLSAGLLWEGLDTWKIADKNDLCSELWSVFFFFVSDMSEMVSGLFHLEIHPSIHSF